MDLQIVNANCKMPVAQIANVIKTSYGCCCPVNGIFLPVLLVNDCKASTTNSEHEPRRMQTSSDLVKDLEA